ncbi:hypothetical protein YH65_03420 [Sulfurovum lithotrophicum]|uniref:TonB-dependent receptor plug domain-containing protein n=1 Tax=Sulfurovum lithotrophicum TaxID=206403 RepID=A0A7U4M0F7_9BACT|nr:hypothetical protein [Sulfurovum lithotrophicum]AKF24545.1 hypothetical protein YH65_03420 [Sulfurovum lithotrophicum]
MPLKYILLTFVFFVFTEAGDINSLLKEYDRQNALSQKTIDANKGHLVLFTREKLERMHAKTLKDVFKTTPVIYYHENRYALPDPLTSGSFEPYRSNFIRLFIDGVEITQGWLGSGLVLYGDVNIDFVDHIEFYYLTPSFETSVEPAFLTIYLYSKDPKRDSGGKVSLIQGSRGYNMQTASYGEQRENFSYMVNLSHTNAIREKVDNGTPVPLSRDFERTQIFSYIKTDTQIFHLQIMDKRTDSFAGPSWDATPIESNTNYLNLHMDYGIDLSSVLHAQISYDWLKTDMNYIDDKPFAWWNGVNQNNTFIGESKNSTYTADLTYNDVFKNHHITAGVKGRYKSFDSLKSENMGTDAFDFSHEIIGSLFFQDQYMLTEDQLLSAGLSYNYIVRNGGVTNDSLLQLRLGYIFTGDEWGYKAYLYRTQVALEPLMRYFYPEQTLTAEAQTTLGFTQEVSFHTKNQQIRLILHMMKDENGLLKNSLIANTGETEYYTAILNYDYAFDRDNKLNLQLYYARYNNIFNLDNLDDISGYFSFFNSYGNFDFYNGLVWHRNSLDWKNYLDWTSTVSWNLTEQLSITLKGDNILNRAKKTKLYRLDVTTQPPTIMEPLSVTPIDRRFTIELEYLF